jgi:hypothetical protein
MDHILSVFGLAGELIDDFELHGSVKDMTCESGALWVSLFTPNIVVEVGFDGNVRQAYHLPDEIARPVDHFRGWARALASYDGALWILTRYYDETAGPVSGMTFELHRLEIPRR